MPVMFSDAKHIQPDFVSERHCFEQLAEMSCRIDAPPAGVNGCRDETVYPNLHVLLILVHAAMRGCQSPVKAERTLRNTTIQSTVTTIAKARPLGAIKR